MERSLAEQLSESQWRAEIQPTKTPGSSNVASTRPHLWHMPTHLLTARIYLVELLLGHLCHASHSACQNGRAQTRSETHSHHGQLTSLALAGDYQISGHHTGEWLANQVYLAQARPFCEKRFRRKPGKQCIQIDKTTLVARRRMST